MAYFHAHQTSKQECNLALIQRDEKMSANGQVQLQALHITDKKNPLGGESQENEQAI